VEIRRLVESDAATLVACVRRCYGETYGEPGFYDEDWLVTEMRSGRFLSIGACAGERLIGHLGATVRTPGDAVGDTVAGMIEPAYRGRGLVQQMGRLLFAGFREWGIVATRHLATGTHLRTQRPLAESGAVPTGVLLGHVRARTQFRGVEHRFGDHRIGVVVYFQRYGALSDLEVYLPARYAPVLAVLYRRAGLGRRDRLGSAPARRTHDRATADITVRHNWAAELSTVHIAAAPDARIPADELASVLTHRADVTYVDVPLAHPGCPAIVDWLHGRGFVFGALLPGTIDSEHIRMQDILASQVDPAAIECANADVTRLRDWIASELAPTSDRPSQ
jgi:hypothetical protein